MESERPVVGMGLHEYISGRVSHPTYQIDGVITHFSFTCTNTRINSCSPYRLGLGSIHKLVFPIQNVSDLLTDWDESPTLKTFVLVQNDLMSSFSGRGWSLTLDSSPVEIWSNPEPTQVRQLYSDDDQRYFLCNLVVILGLLHIPVNRQLHG